MLYQIIIYPIELIIELTYALLKRVVVNPGLAIIGVSLAVQILTLPLYAIAEKWQKVERNTQAKLKPKIDKIKAVFKGDEQYMILSTYYKQNSYHPIFAMRSTIGLLIQIPFFLAAYTFLSNLETLHGASFYFIQNLGAPDALFSIGSFSFNVLPIIMTAINIVSALVYTKGFALKEKAQLYGMAILFLVLLYNSPSALVLYWTLNNLFSLIKNIISKAKNPLKLFYIVACSAVILAAIFYLFFVPNQSNIRKLFIITVTILIISIPLCLRLISFLVKFFLQPLQTNKSKRNLIFSLATLSLSIILGLLIPSSLIVTSVQEFSYIENIDNPIYFIMYSFTQSAGIFLFWIPLLYVLFSDTVKVLFSWITLSLFFVCLAQTFFVIGDYGLISSALQFETGIPKMPDATGILLDGLVIFTSFFIPLLLIKKQSGKILLPFFSLANITLIFISIYNMVTIQSNLNTFSTSRNAESNSISETVYNISQTESNVIVIMLDKAISSFVPIIFEENTHLKKQFDGFTYYPNTVSVNGHTLMGTPPLYGGYEYLPEEVNKRIDESLVSKHNEALAVLPVLFSENGFKTTITDASWANYSYIPDNRIFTKWPQISAKNVIGSKTQEWTKKNNIDFIKQSELLKRNLFFFSVFRAAPTSLRGALYDNGKWWQEQTINPDLKNYIDNFSSLDLLKELTNINSITPTFNVIVNESTHNSIYLQYPEYRPANIVTSVGENIFNSEYIHKTYHVNIGPLRVIGDYLDFLRANNAYENTRIIIVSDHGDVKQQFPIFENFHNRESNPHPEAFHSLLMVKDFNSTESVITDMTFMTNADVPILATQGILENASNPFTSQPLSNETKANGIEVYVTPRFVPEKHNKNTFILDGETWHVKENIFIPENWKKIK